MCSVQSFGCDLSASFQIDDMYIATFPGCPFFSWVFLFHGHIRTPSFDVKSGEDTDVMIKPFKRPEGIGVSHGHFEPQNPIDLELGGFVTWS